MLGDQTTPSAWRGSLAARRPPRRSSRSRGAGRPPGCVFVSRHLLSARFSKSPNGCAIFVAYLWPISDFAFPGRPHRTPSDPRKNRRREYRAARNVPYKEDVGGSSPSSPKFSDRDRKQGPREFTRDCLLFVDASNSIDARAQFDASVCSRARHKIHRIMRRHLILPNADDRHVAAGKRNARPRVRSVIPWREVHAATIDFGSLLTNVQSKPYPG